MPAISSRAFGRKIMGWTVTPVMRASGFAARARAQHVGGRFAHRLFAGQVEPHAADVGFVHDVGREDLHGDRAAAGQDRRRGRRGLVGVARENGRRDRNRVGREQPRNLDRIEPCASVRDCALDDPACRLRIGREILRQAGRRLHQVIDAPPGSARDA